MPEISQVKSNPLLRDYLLKYTNDEFIGKQVIPIAPVPKRVFRVQTLNLGPMRVPDAHTAPRTIVNQVEFEASQTEYSVEDRYLEEPVDRIEQKEADFDELAEATDFIAENLALVHEKDVADFIFNTAQYAVTTNRVQLGGGDQFGDAACKAVTKMWTGIAACLKYPTIAVFGLDAYLKFATNPETLSAFGISGGSNVIGGRMVTADDVAKYFKLRAVYIGTPFYDSSKKGQTSVYTRLWGKHVALLHQVAQPTRRSVTHSTCFSNTQSFAGQYFEPRVGPQGADIVKAGWDRKIVLVSNRLGYYIQDAAA